MKKIIGLVSAVLFLFYAVPCAANSAEDFYMDFNGFEMAVESETDNFYNGINVRGTRSGDTYAGVYPASFQGDSFAEMRANCGNTLRIYKVFGSPYENSVSVSTEILIRDQNVRRCIKFRGVNSGGKTIDEQTVFYIDRINGNMVLWGEKIGCAAETDKLYKITLSYNMNSGLMKCEIFESGKLIADKSAEIGLDLKTLANIYICHQGDYFVSGTASTLVKSISAKNIPELIYPFEANYNLEGFVCSENGQSVPEGISLFGGVPNKNGLFERDGSIFLVGTDGIVGIVQKFPIPVKGKAAVYTEIFFDEDGGGKVFFTTDKNAEMLCFDRLKGEISLFGNTVGRFELNKKYSVCFVADTFSKSASAFIVCDDNELVFTAGNIEMGAALAEIGIYTADNSEIQVLSFGACTVGETSFSGVTETDEKGRVIPSDIITLRFTAPVKNCEKITINGQKAYVDSIDGSLVKLNVNSLLEYGKKYLLEIDNLRDMFGGTVSVNTEFETVPTYETDKILISAADGIAESEVQVTVYDGNRIEAEFVLASYAENGKMENLKIKKIDLSEGSTKEKLSLEIPEGGFAESFVLDNFSEMNIFADKTSAGAYDNNYVDDDSSEISFEYNSSKNKIALKGFQLQQNNGVLIVLKPGKTLKSLNEDPETSICYIKEFSDCLKNGYKFTASDINGEFDVIYKTGDNVSYKPEAFSVYSAEMIKEIISKLNEATPDIDLLIRDNYKILGIKPETYLALNSEQQKRSVESIVLYRNALDSGEFKTIEEFKEIYGSVSAAETVSAENSSKKIPELLKKYDSILGITNDVSYKTFEKTNAKELVYEAFAAKKDFRVSYDVLSYFREQTVLKSVQGVKNSLEISEIINDNNAWLNWDFSIYDSLKNPYNVNSAVAGKEFDTIESLKNAFRKAVTAQKRKESGSTSFGSSGSSGGGGMNIKTSKEKLNVDDRTIFTDMDSCTWAKEAVKKLFEMGIISGKENGKFDPYSAVTREEFTKMAVLSLKTDKYEYTDLFEDVKKDMWYAPYVCSAARNGFVLGMGEGKFGIGEKIKREDAAVILARTLNVKSNGKKLPFDDVNMISDYAKESVAALFEYGIINGSSDGSFAPEDSLGRAEAAVMFYNILSNGEFAK